MKKTKPVTGYVLTNVVLVIVMAFVCNYLWEANKDQIFEFKRKNWDYSRAAIEHYNKAVSQLRLAESANESRDSSSAASLYGEAIEHFKAADTAGIVEATFALGIIYCHGRPGFIEQNPAMAKSLIYKAGSNGLERAKAHYAENCGV